MREIHLQKVDLEPKQLLTKVQLAKHESVQVGIISKAIFRLYNKNCFHWALDKNRVSQVKVYLNTNLYMPIAT